MNEYSEEAISSAINFFENLNLRMSVEDFMRKLLEISLAIFPIFDRGSVIIRHGGEWRYVAWIGYPDELGEIRATNLYIPDGENPVVVDRIMEMSRGFLTRREIEQFEKVGSELLKKTVAVAIRVDNKAVGGIFLDSTKDVHITDDLLKAMKAFGKLASIFTAMKLYQERERGYQREIILAMRKAMEARDPHTVGHSERVARYAVSIAKKLGLDMKEVDKIYWGSIIHDIGKLAVPEQILLKPTKLSPEEYEVVKRHTIVGYSMLEGYPWLENIRHILRSHHERCDGNGYPDGLRCDEIPLDVKVVSVADAFDAMTSHRAYRKALSLEQALHEIEKEAGKQFDPEVARTSLSVLEELFDKNP